jgi:hypothetical protein
MIHFSVTIRDESGVTHYSAIAHRSIDVVCDAFDLFGVCSVTVRRA